MSWFGDYFKISNILPNFSYFLGDSVSSNKLIFDYSNSICPEDSYSPSVSAVKSSTNKLPESICSQKSRASLNDFFSRNYLGSYNWTLLKDNETAIKSSQKHLLGLIKYYEGDRHHYYEGYTSSYRDNGGNGTLTGGFGSIKDVNIKTNEEAYARLEKDLIEHTGYVISKCGGTTRTEQFKNFKNIPASIREALIDLSFNKGPDEIDKEILQDAIKQKNWSSIIPMLPKAKGSNVETVAGLYRRSLSRTILSIRDLSGKELKEAKEEVEKIYKECVSYHKKNNLSLNDVNAIWNLYNGKNINIKIYSTESAKHKVKKGDSYYSIAKTYCPEGEDVAIFVNIIKQFNNVPKDKNILSVGRLINIPLEYNGKSTKVTPLVTRGNDESQQVGVNSNKPVVQNYSGDKQSRSGKIYLFKNKPKSYFSLVTELLEVSGKEQINAVIKEIGKLNNIKLKDMDANGWLGLEGDIPDKLILPTEIVVDSKVIKLKSLNENESNPKNEEKDFVEYLVKEKYKGKGLYSVAEDLFESYKEVGLKKRSDLLDILNTINEGRTFAVGNSILIPTKEYVKTKIVAEGGTTSEHDDKDIDSSLSKLLEETKKEKLSYIEIKKDTNPKTTIYEFKYIVKNEDSVYRIEKRYGIKPGELLRYNNLKSNSIIKPGQTINIPKVIYKVESGDSLNTIAQKYGVKAEILSDMNNISNPNVIKQGQLLELPAQIYTVKKGENLTDIAKKASVDLALLKKVNKLNNNSIIHPGDKLVVLFNDISFKVGDSPEAETSTTSKISSVKYNRETIGDFNNIESLKYIKKPMYQNGRVVATRVIFNPTNTLGNAPLRGKTVIVNAGHGYKSSGDYDPGVVRYKSHGLNDEWEINYCNAMYLAKELCAKGAKVIFLQGQKTLVQNELKKKENKADYFISLHVNSAGNTKDRTQFFVRNVDIDTQSKHYKLAKKLENRFDNWIPSNEKITQKEAWIYQGKKDYAQLTQNDNRTGILTSAKNKGMVSVLWEVAFASEAKGRARLNDKGLMQNYAKQAALGLVEYDKQK